VILSRSGASRTEHQEDTKDDEELRDSGIQHRLILAY